VERWPRWGLEIEYSSPDRVVEGSAQSGVAIPDADPQGVQSSIAIDATGAATDIKVSVGIGHAYQGDLLVELVALSGRSAALHNRTGAQRTTCVRPTTSRPHRHWLG
jgi:subtilisin-like proprotein convertase family protein